MREMRLVVIAGPPGSGKTSILMHVVRSLISRSFDPAVVKIDCISSEDDKRIAELKVPVMLGLSKDMCPDHFAIYGFEEMIEWAKKMRAEILFVETAGLCLRCAPYPDKCLAVCVIDVTSGPNTPLKVGPLLTTADVIVTTKGDMVSQAEREVFWERVIEANPTCKVIEANGITGKGINELVEMVVKCLTVNPGMQLRHNPPFAICTLCTGERRIEREHHRGLLRHLDGSMEYVGE